MTRFTPKDTEEAERLAELDRLDAEEWERSNWFTRVENMITYGLCINIILVITLYLLVTA